MIICEPTEVEHSNYAEIGSIAGTFGVKHEVVCDRGYEGGGEAVCRLTHTFNYLECPSYI